MPLEGPIIDLSSLNENWPLDTLPDEVLEGDDHIRNVKDAIKKGFTTLGSAGGVVTASAAELNQTVGATGNLQQQIDGVSGNWVRVDTPTFNANLNQNLLINPPSGGTVITLPTTPIFGGQIQALDVGGQAGGATFTITFARSGGDLIDDLDTGTNGLTSYQVKQNTDQIFLVYQFTGGINRWALWTRR